jgi:choline dehydrogenase-like flavoprotein
MFDAIVVGSGITGGWAAKELAEHGLKVLLLERGRDVRHAREYPTEHVPPWRMRFRGEGNKRAEEHDYPVQRRNFLFNEYNHHFFVDDLESPYLVPSDRPFNWFRSHQVGGRSLVWGRQSQRWSEQDFEANARDGHGVDWPIRYRDLAPWYDHVEDFIGVSGNADGLPQLPDGRFLPPMELNCIEQHFKSRVETAFPGRSAIIGRVAVLTRPHRGRAACHYCGPCDRGCSVGAYFSTQSSTLPAAVATGNLTLLPDRIAERLEYDPVQRRVRAVNVINSTTRERERYTAKLFFLCASTLGTTQLLLQSHCEEFPRGLANSSGVLGHHLMDQAMVVGAVATFPGFGEKYYYGVRPNSMFVPRFQNLAGQEHDFVRGYAYQGGGWRSGWRRGAATTDFGASFKQAMRRPGPWMLLLVAFCECLPRASNHVELAEHDRDPLGLPKLKIRFSFGDNEVRMARHAHTQAVAMVEAAGGTVIRGDAAILTPGSAIHEMGTARMGKDPKTSVLNGHNQSHDIANLFVTDGACMASSACQPPSLTYMALTARACRYAVDQLGAGMI